MTLLTKDGSREIDEACAVANEGLNPPVLRHADRACENAKAFVTAISDSVIGFAGAVPQSDDITITVLRWEPL